MLRMLFSICGLGILLFNERVLSGLEGAFLEGVAKLLLSSKLLHLGEESLFVVWELLSLHLSFTFNLFIIHFFIYIGWCA